MGCNFYAGHDFEWIDKFIGAIQKKRYLRKGTAVNIACCIHHLYVYKRQKTFKITHKTLTLFGVDSRYIKPYLVLFQQAGLIKFNIKIGKTPTITLLLIPPSNYNKT